MSKITELPERRRYQRISIAIPVFVRGLDAQKKEFLEFATALNVSAGGALLVMRRTLPRFSGLSLEFPSAPLPGPRGAFPKALRTVRARLLRINSSHDYQLWAVKFTTPALPKAPADGKYVLSSERVFPRKSL